MLTYANNPSMSFSSEKAQKIKIVETRDPTLTKLGPEKVEGRKDCILLHASTYIAHWGSRNLNTDKFFNIQLLLLSSFFAL